MTSIPWNSFSKWKKELPKGQKIKEVNQFDAEKVVGWYSKTKAMATQAVLDAVKNQGLNACVVHPSGILEPQDYATLIDERLSYLTGTDILCDGGCIAGGASAFAR